VVESIRGEQGKILLLDCGGVFSDPNQRVMKLKAEISLEAMDLMGYDALNLGARELSLGLEFLRGVSSPLSLPLLSSNLVHENGRIPWIKDRIIRNVKGFRVAILGIMPAYALEAMPNPRYAEHLKIIPPETALKSLLPEVKKEADLIILLSQCGPVTTSSLVTAVGGIDLAISCRDQKPDQSSHEGGFPVFRTGSRGTHIGYVQVTRNDTGTVSIGQNRPVELGDSVPSDNRIRQIIQAAYLKECGERRQLEAEKRRQQMHKGLLKGLELTPKEFFEREQKRQDKYSKGQ
jgi:2',3'-cyclic-nucleotide 2'-phosphodiesterase (5'-nucleotidase family)